MKVEKVAALLLGISLFAASSGMTSAYLTVSPNAIKNVITTGSVEVDLTEPSWNPEDAKGLTPEHVVPKNPTVTNTGENTAWIFLRLSVPVKNICLVDPQTKRRQPTANTELFSFEICEGWELIERNEGEDAVDYVYGFTKPVPPQESTIALFEQVKLVNFLEGELHAEEILYMPVEAVAIQDAVCPPGAQLAEIYHVYLEQEETGS